MNGRQCLQQPGAAVGDQTAVGGWQHSKDDAYSASCRGSELCAAWAACHDHLPCTLRSCRTRHTRACRS